MEMRCEFSYLELDTMIRKPTHGVLRTMSVEERPSEFFVPPRIISRESLRANYKFDDKPMTPVQITNISSSAAVPIILMIIDQSGAHIALNERRNAISSYYRHRALLSQE